MKIMTIKKQARNYGRALRSAGMGFVPAMKLGRRLAKSRAGVKAWILDHPLEAAEVGLAVVDFTCWEHPLYCGTAITLNGCELDA